MLEHKILDDFCIELKESSNLPGPRANLEKMHHFNEMIQKKELTQDLFDYLKTMWKTPSNGNDPELMVVVSGLLSLANYYFEPVFEDEVSEVFKEAMSDERWRVREIIQEALLIVATRDYDAFVQYLETIKDPSMLELRAIITTLAHPQILKNTFQQNYALNYLKRSFYIYESYTTKASTKDPAFDALTKGMMFAPSVIIAACPEQGFTILQYMVGRGPLIDKIIVSNLKKARLAKKYPNKCRKIQESMGL